MFNEIQSYHSLDTLAFELIKTCFPDRTDDEYQNIADSLVMDSETYLNKQFKAYRKGKLTEVQITMLYTASALFRTAGELCEEIN